MLAVKPYGDRTGMLVADANDVVYLLRFDPKNHVELQTGAEMVASKFYWAAGYNVLEGYLVYFERDRLIIPDGAEQVTSFGELRDLIPEDIDNFLKTVAYDRDRGFRAVATRTPRRLILGNYQFYATRSDDPNDVVPHEHRRDLRGMWVLHAWLNSNQFNPSSTLEAVIEENGSQYIRRYIVDPGWAAADYGGHIPAVGRFEGVAFDADKWVADTHFITWANRLPDDLYWGAKLVMSFTDEKIRAITETGGYSDGRAAAWLADALILRRDKIGRAFFSHVLPLDNFRVENSRLEFDDLMTLY